MNRPASLTSARSSGGNRRAGRSLPGFTLIELIVAISVAGVMVFLINRIFFETSSAVSKGIQTSQLIGNSRAMSDQIARDLDPVSRMLGPVRHGVLTIVQKTYLSVGLQVSPPFKRNLRSDQLSFFADVSGTRPLAPGRHDIYENNLSSSIQYARVWLGHVVRTNSNGLTADPDIASAAGVNSVGNRFILGRQSLLFCGDTLTPADVEIYYDSVTGKIVDTSGSAPANGKDLYTAYTDVSNYKLFVSGASPPDNVVVSDQTTASIPPLPTRAVYDGLDAASYRDRLLPLLFVTDRLWVNPTPQFNNLPNSYTAAQVPQMHPYLMGDVSDFCVDFAGDYDADGNIDIDTTGNIKWYGHFYNNATEGNRLTGIHDPQKPSVYKPVVGPNGFDDVGTPTSPLYFASGEPAPYNTGLTAKADAVFIFRHDDSTSASRWPHLLRIRYRLHDKNCQLLDYHPNPQEQPGKWFEQVVKVDRP